VTENAGLNAEVGILSATDSDAGDTHTFALVSGVGGADNASFNISGNNLRATNPLNFEAKSSYSVLVQATDSGGLTYTKALTVSVTDVNEAPSVTSGGTANVAENSTAVQTVTGSDPDAGATLIYSITGGADSLLFAIDGSSGALTFVSAPDFENPGDAGTDNIYNVTVQVSDGSLTATKDVAVTVTDVNENTGDTTPPVITLNGDNPLTVLWGLTWIDDYSAFDAGDNAAVTVNRVNPVDTKVPGSYTVTYTASDSQGNAATNTRIVNVRFAGGGTNRGPDGLPDAVRFAMGADGTNAIDRTLLPTTQLSGSNLVLNYHARPGSSPVDMVPVVSTDLANSNSWTTAGITVTTNGTTNANGVTLEKRQATVPSTDGTRKFLRLRATTSQ
jgi:VCBS repeat-containing protein